jgi:hypothetical protein
MLMGSQTGSQNKSTITELYILPLIQMQTEVSAMILDQKRRYIIVFLLSYKCILGPVIWFVCDIDGLFTVVVLKRKIQGGIVILQSEDTRNVKDASGYIKIRGYALPEGEGAGQGGLVLPS